MTKTTKHQREIARAADLRARAIHLLQIPDHDWTDWEMDWLYDETRRAHDYIYSDKEWRILEQLERYAQSFSTYAGLSVETLVGIGFSARFDVGEDDQEFIERLFRREPSCLKRREIGRLAGICRLFEDIAYDDLVHGDAEYHGEAEIFRAA